MTTITNDETGTELSIGDDIIIDGEVRTVNGIKGRWVALDNGTNVSRATAFEGRDEYLEDSEELGEEFENEEEAGDEPEDDGEGSGKDIIKKKYRETYTRTRRPDGRRSMDSGDQVAVALRAMTLDQILALVYRLRPELDGTWTHLNPGQRSMSARNAIRRMIKNGDMTVDQIA